MIVSRPVGNKAALVAATARHFRPEFILELRGQNIPISMDGRGPDKAKMERFWWALKYEDITIKKYVSVPQPEVRRST